MHGQRVDILIKIGDNDRIACHVAIHIMERIRISTAADLIRVGKDNRILALGPNQGFTSAA